MRIKENEQETPAKEHVANAHADSAHSSALRISEDGADEDAEDEDAEDEGVEDEDAEDESAKRTNTQNGTCALESEDLQGKPANAQCAEGCGENKKENDDEGGNVADGKGETDLGSFEYD